MMLGKENQEKILLFRIIECSQSVLSVVLENWRLRYVGY